MLESETSELKRCKSIMIKNLFLRIKKNQFLFEELVKRDFKQKYKRTVLGMLWSLLLPLMQLFVMTIVFTRFFGNSIEHYSIYLFCGNLVFNYFKESTNSGMNAIISNTDVLTKVNVPKYLFLLSKNVSSLINFGLSIIVFLLYVLKEGLPITWNFLCLLYPTFWLLIFNIGVGLVLSALFVFFRDISYLYDIFTLMLMYCSAIFYSVQRFGGSVERYFLMNPLYCYIKYFRVVVLDGNIPSLQFHLLCAGYAIVAMIVGSFFYKKFNHKFLYYI